MILAQASQPTALNAIAQMRQRMPNENYLYWPEGIVYMTKGDYQKAFLAFDRLGQDPSYVSIGQIFKGQIRLEQDNLGDAEVLLSRGLSTDIESSDREAAQRHILLAEIATRRNDRPDAQRRLGTLLSEKGGLGEIPENLKSLRSAAIASIRAGAIGPAEQFSQKISRLATKFPSVISLAIDSQVRGEIAEFRGKPDQAMTLVQDAFDHRHEPFIAASFLRLLVNRGECTRAEGYARDLRKSPGLIYADYTVPWIEIHDALDLVAKHCTPK
jgi:tetratricopeptide (TPR) repeat protein